MAVISSRRHEPHTVADEEPDARFGMWVFLVTDAMSFGALLGAYASLRAGAASWPHAAARSARSPPSPRWRCSPPR